MDLTKLGISREFLPVPGDTITEVICDRGLSQTDLANKLNMTQSYISQVIFGHKPISKKLAKGLEDVLGVKTSFWLNLQANYETMLRKFNEEDGIDDEERSILRQLRKAGVEEYLRKAHWISQTPELIDTAVLSFRDALNVESLGALAKVADQGAFRVANTTRNPVVMGAWLLCAERISDKDVRTEFRLERMPDLVRSLKAELNEQGGDLQSRLSETLGSYGISLAVMPHFKGAPVQGHIAKGKGEKETYCIVLTIRGGRADRFWFTLFHEIGHIVNGDLARANSFLDWASAENSDASASERAADEFARQALLDEKAYADFVDAASKSCFPDSAIQKFAESQNVPAWIVKGRLQKEQHISYDRSAGIPKYVWAD